ncbi:MAG: hypothetical protein M1825_004946 [Sarcosagium campestre]|nr:MAG: hypothetical protein M1825_004946 [Sarcosagium campestre]
MSLTLKQEIETWVKALAHYDNNEFEDALKEFDAISETSKILFNCGVIRATLGEHGKAIECYQKATRLDQYFALSYFQQGVSNFLIGDFEEALANFNDTLLYLRGNTFIDYDQLGLKFKLYSCEVLFNRGLCYIYLQQKDAGMHDFQFAVKEKQVDDHNVIDEAIKEEAQGYTVFSIPVGLLYRPNEAKVKNLKTKDYLGKARLVAASDRNNAFTGFAGQERKMVSLLVLSSQNGGRLTIEKSVVQETPKDDRPTDAISFAASNLVKPDLRSRTRQQSEPPINRQVFPPTPPPEAEKPFTLSGRRFSDDRAADRKSTGSSSLKNESQDKTSQITGRGLSVRSGSGRPERLDLARPRATEDQAGQPAQPPPPQFERPRIGTSRTASEPRGPTRQYSQWRNTEQSRTRQVRNIPSRQPGNEKGDDYADDLYDMYNAPRSVASPPRLASRPRVPPSLAEEGEYVAAPLHRGSRPRYIEEEEEIDGSEYDGSDDVDEGDFEMMSSRPRSRKLSVRSHSRAPELRKIRVKVHVGEDTRYVLIGPAVEFLDFMDRVRDKFGIRNRFRCRIKDEGDMITMADQDDLDLAVATCKKEARREGSDMGKIEVWVQETK